MSIETVNDLSVYPTDDLLDEVLKRCSPAVFIGTKYDESGKGSVWKSIIKYSGNLCTCYGLCSEAGITIHQELIRREIEAD